MRIELPDEAITIAQAATGFGRLDPATQAAMGLQGEILEEQGVHRAFEADVKLADFPFRHGDDLHPGKLEALEQGGDIGLVAGDAVQGFGQHNIELPGLGVAQQGLDAGAQHHADPGDGRVAIVIYHLPALARGALFTEPELVLDRGRPLVVRGIAGIERDTGHGETPAISLYRFIIRNDALLEQIFRAFFRLFY